MSSVTASGSLLGPEELAGVHQVRWPGSIWLSGTTILLCYYGTTRMRLFFERRRMTVVSSNSEMEHLFSALGAHPIRVRVWPVVKGPVSFGIVRPTVAVPSDFAQRFSKEQRQAMLAHEVAHLIARDPAWFALADLLCALLWWHPSIWWGRKKLRHECEAAADEASAVFPGGPISLAESLVAFGRELSLGQGGNQLGVVGAGSTSDLGRRVYALLNASVRWNKLSFFWRWAPRLSAACLVCGFMALPWQSAYPRSGLQLLANCLPDAGGQEQNGPFSTAATAEITSSDKAHGVLLVEFAEIPDAQAALLEGLFLNRNMEETTGPAGHVESLFSGTNPPSQKNVIASRSSTRDQIALMTSPEFAGLRRSLTNVQGVDWVTPSAQGIEVRPGHEVHASVIDIQSIVSDLEASDGTGTNPAVSIDYKVGELATGPEARVRTHFSNGEWRLDVSARRVDFLGYEEPRPSGNVVAWTPSGEPKAVPIGFQIPIPHVSIYEVNGTSIVPAGKTLVLRGPRKAGLKVKSSHISGSAEHVAKASRFYVFVSLTAKGVADKSDSL